MLHRFKIENELVIKIAEDSLETFLDIYEFQSEKHFEDNLSEDIFAGGVSRTTLQVSSPEIYDKLLAGATLGDLL